MPNLEVMFSPHMLDGGFKRLQVNFCSTIFYFHGKHIFQIEPAKLKKIGKTHTHKYIYIYPCVCGGHSAIAFEFTNQLKNLGRGGQTLPER